MNLTKISKYYGSLLLKNRIIMHKPLKLIDH